MHQQIERVPLTRFFPFVMASCPELPEEMALAYIRQAAIEFCQRSSILRRYTRLDQQARVSEYPIWPDDTETVVRVTGVNVGEGWRFGRGDGWSFWCCGGHWEVRDGLVQVCPTPQCDQPGGIEVRFVAAPSQEACEADELLYQDWRRAVTAGALAELHMLPGYPFTAPGLADRHRIRFEGDIRRARVHALKGDAGRPTFARATPFV